MDAAALPPRPVLHPRLVANPRQGAGADAVEAGDDRQVERPQRRHRRHPPLDQTAPLAAVDAGHERQVVVGAAPLRADLLPLADVAVLDRFGIGIGRCIGVRLESPADGAVVGRVLDDPEAREVPLVAAAERQVHPFRLPSLHPGQEVRIQEELQHRLALRAAGQLRVEHLVRPGAQRARRVDPKEEVGIAAPPAVLVLQAPLVDDVGSAPHRVPRAGVGRDRVPVGERRVGRGDDLHRVPLRREPLQQTPLVLDAALPQHVATGVVIRGRRPDLPQRDAPAQGRQMAAGEVAAEVCGREREPAVGEAHGAGR